MPVDIKNSEKSLVIFKRNFIYLRSLSLEIIFEATYIEL